MRDEPASVVRTAEVLAILKAAGRRANDRAVQQGKRAILEQVQEQERRLEPSRRLTRNVSYALLGLCEFDFGDDPDVERVKKRCVETLSAAFLPGQGWSVYVAQAETRAGRRGTAPTSIFQTVTAIVALDRHGRSRKVLEAGRDTLLAMRPGTHKWWPLSKVRHGASFAMTAQAIIALRAGAKRHLDAAAEAHAWLLDHHGRWKHATDPDDIAGTSGWVHMTFSLGVRACLASGTSPVDSRIRESFKHMDELWVPGSSEWAERRGAPTTVRASLAVVLASEALRRALYRADPYEVVLGHGRGVRSHGPSDVTDASVTLGPDGRSLRIAGPALDAEVECEIIPSALARPPRVREGRRRRGERERGGRRARVPRARRPRGRSSAGDQSSLAVRQCGDRATGGTHYAEAARSLPLGRDGAPVCV